MFTKSAPGTYKTNPQSNPNSIFQKNTPNTGLIFPNSFQNESKNQNSLFEKKQEKTGFSFNEKSTQPNQMFTNGSIFSMPNKSDQTKGIFFNNFTKNQTNTKTNLFQNKTPNLFQNKTQPNTFQNKIKPHPFQNKTQPNPNIFTNQPKTLNNINSINPFPNLIKNENNQNGKKGLGLTNMFQNMNLNSPNSLPDNLSQQLKYSILSAFQRIQYQKNNLIKQNQFLNKRVQNLQGRNKELIDIINNLVAQKGVNNLNNSNKLNNSNPLNNGLNSANLNTNILNNQANFNLKNENLYNPNSSNRFANQINQINHPLEQLLNHSTQLYQTSNTLSNINSNINPTSVAVNLFKQDNIEPMAFTQKIFITDDGYAIKALITFNAFYAIKFIIIEQIQNNNGCFIFNTDQILKNPLRNTLAQIQNKGYWFLFNPASNKNALTYNILQEIQPKIIQALKENSNEWIKLHINMQNWCCLKNDPNQRVNVYHSEWQSSNCQIILYNYLNFNNSNNETKQIIKYKIEQWINQTQKVNKQNNKNNVIYFDQTSGKLHMILSN